MAAAFAAIRGSFAGSRWASPMTEERSAVTTETPARSRIFSLNRTVLNAAGRAPRAPSRARRRPRTTRHTAANHSRSARNSGAARPTVCRRVSEKA